MPLQNPIGIAAGICKTVGDVRIAAKTKAAFITVGSFTSKRRIGQKGITFHDGGFYSLNATFLRNGGSKYLERYLPQMVQIAHDSGKLLFVNIAGTTPEEFLDLTTLATRGNADMVTFNLGCPNIEERECAIAHDPLLVERILWFIRGHYREGPPIPLAVKLPPLTNSLERIAKIIVDAEIFRVVVSSNTFPNAFALDRSGNPRITPQGGLGGLGGKALKPIALGQVYQLRQMLPPEIQLVGGGGIFNEKDFLDFRHAGAQVVKILTGYHYYGAWIFDFMLGNLERREEALCTH